MPDVVLSRRFALGAGLAALSGLVVGCAGSSTPAAVDSASPAGADTRTIVTANGDLQVPTRPQRIVAVAYDTPFQLQAVGVTAVGIFDYSKLYEQYTDEQVAYLKPIPTIGTWGTPDLEKVAALSPDLIVGVADEVEPDVYRQLSQLAPTALFAQPNRADWQSVASSVADVAGAGEALTTVRGQYEAKLAEVKDRYAATLGSQKVVHYSFGDASGQFSVQFPTGVTGAMLAAVGVRFADVVASAKPEAGYVSYSVEKADLLADATVGIYPLANDGTEFADLATTRRSKTWQALPFVRDGRDYGLIQLTGVNTHASAVVALDELEAKVLSKLS